MSRFAALLLGLILILAGVAVAAPEVLLGYLEAEAAPEAVERLRLTTGYGLWALAALLLIAAALWPRRPARRSEAQERVTSPVLPFSEPEPAPFPAAEPLDETLAADAIEPEAAQAPEPDAADATPIAFEADAEPEAPETVEPVEALPAEPDPPAEEPPPPAPEPVRSFAQMREHLREQARAEDWDGAARTLRQMKGAASTDLERAQAAQDLGIYLRGQGKSADAAAVYEDALSYARSAGDPALLADTLIDVGDIASETRRHDVAVSRYEEALALRVKAATEAPQDLEAARRVTLALERLGDAWEDKGYGVRALDLYRRSEELSARLAAADPRFEPDLAATRTRIAELEEGRPAAD